MREPVKTGQIGATHLSKLPVWTKCVACLVMIPGSRYAKWPNITFQQKNCVWSWIPRLPEMPPYARIQCCHDRHPFCLEKCLSFLLEKCLSFLLFLPFCLFAFLPFCSGYWFFFRSSTFAGTGELSTVREITDALSAPSPCPIPRGARGHWTVISRTVLSNKAAPPANRMDG